MDGLLEASKKGSHGLYVREAVRMRRQDLTLRRGRVWIRPVKSGLSGRHPIPADELRPAERCLSRATTPCRGCSCLSAGNR